MKPVFRPARLGFYFLILLVFFVIGLFYAGWTDAGKGQGLAGGAIVLGHGVVFGGMAFIASFYIAQWMEVPLIKKINWVLLLLFIATFGYKYYTFKQRDAQQEQESKKFKPPPTAPTKTAEFRLK